MTVISIQWSKGVGYRASSVYSLAWRKIECVFGHSCRGVSTRTPGQLRWYAYPATARQKKNFAKQGFKNVVYGGKPIGQNTLAKKMKAACKRVGLNCTGTDCA